MSSEANSVAELPCGYLKPLQPSNVNLEMKPGEFVAQTLLVEFMGAAEKKIQIVLQEPVEKLLAKSLQRGEDIQFDQLITALHSVSEHCLPSVLRALFAWYDYQNRQLYLLSQQKVTSAGILPPGNSQHSSLSSSASSIAPKAEANKQGTKAELKIERDFLLEKKGLAIDFIFCLALIEILKQMPLHPGHDDLVNYIVQLAFKQFRYKEPNLLGMNAPNVHSIADLFAEVIGVLAQSRFYAVRRKFTHELSELKGKETSQDGIQSVVSLFMGMKFFRIKMVPIEEFEISMSFLHELGAYFSEVKDREIKHALAGLFVEILIPVAANVKTEVNVPALKNFVDLLYAHTLDWAAKRKHSLAFFPLLTCLLCISQKQFFLSNWHYFLTMCLSNLKNKDPKMCRVALESLYRLLWVYVVRIKCESNTATQSRLQSICNSLFPKGGRYVIPRDTPLNLFVKILHFIAQERLDFAFKEVIFDLLCVGRPIRTIYPERMNIGLRALLVIADSLQQCDGPPPMPKTINVLPSGNTLRVKRTYLTKPLTIDIARSIGIDSYYGPCLRSFEGMLRTLDMQVGRPMMMTVVQSTGREVEDMLGGERKPKLDLFRTCIAAIPRVLPENMSRLENIDLLLRLTVHMDDELRALACQTLQNIMVECAEWREDIVYGLLQFITKEIHDSYSTLLDNSLRLLHQVLLAWKNAYQQTLYGGRKGSMMCVSNVVTFPKSLPIGSTPNQVRVAPILRSEGCASVLHSVEGLALVMLCQCRASSRRLAVNLMKEVRQMLPLLCANEDFERPVIDVLDSAVSYVVEKYVQHVQPAEKITWPPTHQMDFLWAIDRIPSIETDMTKVNIENGNEYLQWDPWAAALSGFLEPQFLLSQSPSAVAYAWPAAHMRISAVFTYVDPNNPQNDNRASLLRSSKSRSTAAVCAETLNHSNYLSLWEKYLVFSCGVAPPAVSNSAVFVRSVSPLTMQTASESGENLLRLSELRIPRVANVSATNLFRQVLPLLRCEMADMRDIVVLGLGSINPASFDGLLEELAPFLREAAERKQENLRRKKRKDLLRLQLIRLLEIVVFRNTLSSPQCRNSVNRDIGTLKQVFLDIIENARIYLEADHDRDQQMIYSLHLHFAKFIASLVESFPIDKRINLIPNELRKNLFYLFASWSGRLGLVLDRSRQSKDRDALTSDECFAVAGMCAVLCCGPVFDSHAISDDRGYIFGWMDALIASQHEKISALSEETLILLLDYNSDNAHLLEWIIDKCFISQSRVADKCFGALVTVFSSREYPCDVVAMLNLTLMYTGYPVSEFRQCAINLLRILHQRYFSSSSASNSADQSAASPAHYTNKRDIDWSNAMGAGKDKLDQPDFDQSALSQTDEEAERRAVTPTSGIKESSPTDISHQISSEITDGAGCAKSQAYFSQQLAAAHPEMTLQILSEISLRACTAKPARRASMLQYLLPWLHNIELIDPYLEPIDKCSFTTLSLAAKITESHNLSRRVLKGEGWGSQQATEMVLNNLMYLTVAFGNENSNLFESLWSGLILYWPDNLRVILRYLMIIATMSPDTLIPYVKRIIIYIAHGNAERLIEELINELQTIDVFRNPIERSELPPYYRCSRRMENNVEPLERLRGIIHTRRHTPSEPEPAMFNDPLPELDLAVDMNASLTSLITLTADNLNDRMNQAPTTIRETEDQSPMRKKEFLTPFQLPLPAYGGHYCPMSEYLPSTSQPLVLVHRSNLAIVLLTDLVISDAEIEWTVHLPLILHMTVLGLDHSKPLVTNHCRQMLINLIIRYSSGLLKSKDVSLLLITKSIGSQMSIQTRSGYCESLFSGHDRFGSFSSRSTSESMSTNHENSMMTNSSYLTPIKTRNISYLSERDGLVNCGDVPLHDLVLDLVELFSAKKNSPLWAFEDITARNWKVLSADQLSNIVSHLVRLFCELVPNAKIETRWIQTALHVAICCSNRHYAGRSFQIMRALRVPLTSRMLFDVLSRLVETATELGEDMQGYVTEIMITLDANVLHMEVAEHSLINFFKNTQSIGGVASPNYENQRLSPTHQRSISQSVAIVRRSEKKEWRSSVNSIDENYQTNNVAIPRSKSAHALKMTASSLGNENLQDEHVVTLSQLLWIAVSLLESDYEHEYLLALRLYEKLLDLSVNERQDVFDRFERMTKQLDWFNFPGLISLILKGCTFGNTYEPTVHILNKMVTLLDWPVLKPGISNNIEFALCVAAFLPYMLLNFDDPNKICITAAENVAERCVVEFERLASNNNGQANNSTPTANLMNTTPEHPLQLLAIIMRQYAKRTFSKDCFQWAKCVILYLNDVYPQASTQILVFLTEVLDKGSATLSTPVLQIMFCVFQHVELQQGAAMTIINGDFLKVVARHVQSSNWREASRILKFAVTKSSSFVAPPTPNADLINVGGVEQEMQRKELPGRTMEFNFDVASVVSNLNKEKPPSVVLTNLASDGSPRKQLLLSSAETLVRRATICSMAKVREHLLSLLNASGLRVGLPKSPSVIFSQSSHDVVGELPSSVYSSSGELTERPTTPSNDGAKTDVSSDTYAPVFKEFDFLEGEQDSISESADSCFNWLATMRPRSISGIDEEQRARSATAGSVVSATTASSATAVAAEQQIDRESDSSDEEEESTSSQVDYDVIEGTIAAESDQFLNENPPEDRAPTPASLSVCGSLGTPSMADLSGQPFLPFNLECQHHATGQIDEIWNSTISLVSGDSDGSATASATLIFAQLYREACCKMCSLVRDAGHFLSMTEVFREISGQFSDALHILMRVADCPFIFVASQILQNGGILQRQKYYLLELREHYETFQEKRQYTIRCLNLVKSSLKLQLMDQRIGGYTAADQEVELCKSLHKLFFQLLLMCENYTKMIQYFESRSVENTANVTSDVHFFQRDLLRAINDLSGTTGSGSDGMMPPGEMPGSAQQRLSQLVQIKDARQAVLQLRSLRSHQTHGAEYFGCCEEVDVEVLLLLHCKLLSEARYCFAIVGSGNQLMENCNNLMETNVNLSNSVRCLNETIKNRSSVECSEC